jgi:hypothetical protein
MSKEKFTNAYLEAMLWSSSDDDGAPMDRNYDISDIDDDSMKCIIKDCEKFLDATSGKRGSIIRGHRSSHYSDDDDDELAGHDFWLTRSGHGAGFWDGDWPRHVGRFLTKLSTSYPEQYPYVGDDGKIHIF